MEKLERPRDTQGPTERVTTGCGYIYVTPNRNKEGRLIEVFARLGKAGNCAAAQLESLTRAVSLGLKYGIPVEEFVKELKGIRCPSSAWEEGQQILSCADAIARVLEREDNESRDNRSN